MSRIIDADKIDLRAPYSVDSNGEILVPLSAVKQAISMTPTEDVERVVRCEKCKHARMIVDIIGNPQLFCGVHNQFPSVNFDDFCSYGERK